MGHSGPNGMLQGERLGVASIESALCLAQDADRIPPAGVVDAGRGDGRPAAGPADFSRGLGFDFEAEVDGRGRS